ncbi:MAG: GMC family oxidoreductase [Thermoanaerobaculia bacterium]
MFRDGRKVEPGTALDFDVCILGAGAAGITLARALSSAGRTLALVESGGFEYEKATQALYEGTNEGTLLVPRARYLTAGRRRFFGGTTNHWTGWCRPLDPIDFEQRPWLDDSGWPFGRSELDPYYRRAAEVVEIRPFDESPDVTGQERGRGLPEGGRFVTRYFHLSPPTRFGQRYRAELESAADIEVFLHSNATWLTAAADGGAIESVQVATLEGGRFNIRARRFVVALGGVENARLLLLSDDVHAGGFGNQHDLVGRYFMDQPHLAAARIVFPGGPIDISRWRPYRSDALGHRVFGVFCPREEVLREERMLNQSFELRRADDEDLSPEAADLATAAGLLSGGETSDRVDLFDLWARAESRPRRDSRVTLGAERDALGLRRVHLDWRIDPEDRAHIRRAAELFARDLGRFSAARVRVVWDPERLWRGSWGGHHHLGTTRMHDDPRQGVTDADCRVHGVRNLYVAGSSLFPTYGYANPTLTLVALALRLADHLEATLR